VVGRAGGWGGFEIKANSAKLKLELGLSLAKLIHSFTWDISVFSNIITDIIKVVFFANCPLFSFNFKLS
jgi:hypothetical protein